MENHGAKALETIQNMSSLVCTAAHESSKRDWTRVLSAQAANRAGQL